MNCKGKFASDLTHSYTNSNVSSTIESYSIKITKPELTQIYLNSIVGAISVITTFSTLVLFVLARYWLLWLSLIDTVLNGILMTIVLDLGEPLLPNYLLRFISRKVDLQMKSIKLNMERELHTQAASFSASDIKQASV